LRNHCSMNTHLGSILLPDLPLGVEVHDQARHVAQIVSCAGHVLRNARDRSNATREIAVHDWVQLEVAKLNSERRNEGYSEAQMTTTKLCRRLHSLSALIGMFQRKRLLPKNRNNDYREQFLVSCVCQERAIVGHPIYNKEQSAYINID